LKSRVAMADAMISNAVMISAVATISDAAMISGAAIGPRVDRTLSGAISSGPNPASAIDPGPATSDRSAVSDRYVVSRDAARNAVVSLGTKRRQSRLPAVARRRQA